jgi:uncharacterized protein YggE
MKKIFVLFGLAFLLALSACSAPLQEQAAPQSAPQQQNSDAPVRNLMVNGSGQVTLNPDVAYVYIGVQSQSENVASALSDNNGKAQAVAAALRELGIAAEDIQTSSFNIAPQQQYGPEGQVTATTYLVNNTVYVTVRDLQQLGGLLDVVVRTGANSINGITFDVLDKSGAVSDARRLAVESARSQAEEMAAAAGFTLGEIQNMSVYFSQPVTPLYEAKGGFAADASQVPLSAGQLVIRVEVSVTYFIH